MFNSSLKLRLKLKYINRYAQTVNATHIHTSAKTNRGLDEIFNDLSQRKFIHSLQTYLYI